LYCKYRAGRLVYKAVFFMDLQRDFEKAFLIYRQVPLSPENFVRVPEIENILGRNIPDRMVLYSA
jgi:hypothetical protein